MSKKISIPAAFFTAIAFASPALAGGYPTIGEYIQNPEAWDESINFHLRYWKNDKAEVDRYAGSTNPEIRKCVNRALRYLMTNRDALMTGGLSPTHIFYPAAEHYREHTIMPEFRDCVKKAGGE